MTDSARALVRGAISGQRRYVVPASVASAVHQGCEAAVPVMIGVIVDRAIDRQSVVALGWSLLGLVALFAALTISMRTGGWLVRKATQGAAHDLRMRLVRRVLDARGIAERALRSGELLSTATSDAQRVGMVNAAVWTAAGAVGAMAVAAILLLSASVVLGLVVLIGLVPVFLLTTVIAKPLVRRSAVEQAAAATAAGVATDLVSGLRVLSGLGAQAVASARYARVSAQSQSAAVRSASVVAARAGVITALTGGFLAVVAFVGGRLVLSGSVSVGQFVAAIGLTQFLIGPFSRIANVGAASARATASARRLADVFDAPFAVTRETRRPTSVRSVRVELRGVRFGPLRGLDLVVEPGEFLCVVTPDPAAATAMLALLARNADPDAGDLACNGVSCTAMDPELVRSFLLVSWHDAMLFSGTVADNIGSARPAVLDAADARQLDDVLPQGLATPVTERGRSLSGGQRQRVALDRALAKDVPVLVLHDPTTAVDPVTEAKIADGVRKLRVGRSTIVVTTSPALLAVADRVVLLDNGVVATEGTHADLVVNAPRYADAVLT